MRLMLGIVLALLGALAWAHGPDHGRNDVVVTLDPLPPALHGVKAGLYRTLALQLLVQNKSGRPLEVLDERGKPLKRIEAGDDWGWFDARLKTDAVQVPKRVLQAGKPARVGRWSIPVRLGDVRTQLSGTFRYAPPPTGRFEARLTGPAEVSPGVTVTLLRGAIPGVFLENRSDRPVTVYGAAGEPFLVIGPQGVQVNVKSPSWLASGRAESSFVEPIADARAEPKWEPRAASPKFSWLEPRAGLDGARTWEIALRHGDETRHIAGLVEWIPR